MKLDNTSFPKVAQKAYLASIRGCSVNDIDDDDLKEYNLCTGRGKDVLVRPAGTKPYERGRSWTLR